MKKYFLIIIAMVMILGMTYTVGEKVVVTLAGQSKYIPISRVVFEPNVEGENDLRVAFTFNIDKVNEDFVNIISVIEEKNMAVTFYMAKDIIENNPDIIRRIYNTGSEIGLLAFKDYELKNLTKELIIQELSYVSNILKTITGQPLRTIRPDGQYNQEIIYVSEEVGILSVLWDVDSNDKKAIGVADIVERVRKNVNHGSIIYFSGGRYTSKALSIITDNLEQEGYKIFPVDDMVYKENYIINISGEQQRGKQ